MVYIMRLYVDGGCRNNGYVGAIGAAACVSQEKWGKSKTWEERLPNSPAPTNQRAELTAIILALEVGWGRYTSLDSNPYMEVTIYTDSKYALGCMTEWKSKWLRNGYTTSAGHEVVNRDLIEEAYELYDRLASEGEVNFVWIPRGENQDADTEVNNLLDEMAEDC